MHEPGVEGDDPFLTSSLGDVQIPINKRAHELNLLKVYNDKGEEEVMEDMSLRELQVGDSVTVLEGGHEGKTGKITGIKEDVGYRFCFAFAILFE
jgi:transcription antitermination factor NusG